MRLNPGFRALISLALILLSPVSLAGVPSGPTRALLRYPSVHGNTVVFEAAGAIWRSTLQGGVAVRLTADSGYDSHPLISPNGKLVAFTGEYGGSTDVYVIPTEGGAAKQLTWRSVNYPGKKGLQTGHDNVVIGWTPDSRKVVFLSRRMSFNYQVMRAFEVPVSGSLPEPLPMPWSGPLSFDQAGNRIIYNKLSRVLRVFRRKDYIGGQANKLYSYDLSTGASRQLTHWKGESTWPMWVGNTVYFASDRGSPHVLNLWEKNLKTGRTRQLTHFKRFDIDWPSAGNTGVVLSDGGKLYVYSFSTKQLRSISIKIPLDGNKRLPYSFDAGKDIRSATFAPNGRAAVFGAHGALFLLPVGQGYVRKLSAESASNYKNPSWSPDGFSIAYIDDSGSTSRLVVREPQTRGIVKVFALSHSLTYQGPLVWSPNGRYLAYTTSEEQLLLLDLKTGKSKTIAVDLQAVSSAFSDMTFSPDSRWLAFSDHLANFNRALFIYDTRTGKLRQASRGRFSDKNPVFSRNGKYLFFTSARLVNSVASTFGTSTAAADPDGLYVLTLRAGTPSLFAPRQVWDPSTLSAVKACEKASKRSTALATHVSIDFKGLIQRAVRVPVAAANISKIAEAGGILYYETLPVSVLGGKLPGDTSALQAYCLLGRASKTLVKHLSGSFYLSADGLRLFYPKNGDWFIHYADFKTAGLFKTLPIWKMHLEINPVDEWYEVFAEAWRNVRDHFVNPQLIKARWLKLGKKYESLMPLVEDQEDLDFLIGNMMGSLGESHMYIYAGPSSHERSVEATAGLGIDFGLDPKSGYYYIKRIYHGDNTLPGYYAPMFQPGLKVKQGDYIAAINGVSINGSMNPYQYLVGSLGQDVSLTLADKPLGKTWRVIVKPVANSMKLRLLAWIRHNRHEVTKLSNGTIGYVYLNDMEAEGLREFTRQFYRQINKKAIIIDDRWNLGGYVNSVLFNELLQKPVSDWVFRSGAYRPSPASAFPGYLGLLVNHGTASDGDIFAYRFKQYRLGPVIGSRTWGGVRGYFKPFELLDGAHELISEQAMYRDSKWIVEGLGVTPTIEVHEDPGLYARQGTDTQLAAAVKALMAEIKDKPPRVPPPPAWMPAFPAGAEP